MPFTIIVKPDEHEPSALGGLLTTKFGVQAAVAVCDREQLIADALDSDTARSYWSRVADSLPKPSDEEDETTALKIVASSDEGMKLITIFSHIANPLARKELLEFAITLLRQDPVG